MNTASLRVFVPIVVLLSLAACEGCKPQIRDPIFGEPRILVEVDGLNVESSELDFGTVPMTKKVTRIARLTNVGRATLQFDGFAKAEGDAVKLGDTVVEANPVFGIELTPFELPVGESKELTFFFQPPESTMATAPHSVKLKLITPNADPNSPPAFFTLKGTALRGECEFPSTIDFGAVARGDTFSNVQTLKNRRMVDSFPRVGDITSADAVFALTPESPRGEFTISPGRDKTLTFQFTPTEPRDYFGTIKVLPADGCPEVTVRLIGTGVDNVLSWMPSTVDFGFVQPSNTVTQDVTFFNQSFAPIELSGLATRLSNGTAPTTIFKVAAASMGDLTKQTVPAGRRNAMTNAIEPGSATVTLSFKPVNLGNQGANFVGSTNVRSPTDFRIALTGVGGGPDIDVSPSPTLNFGRIAYFAGASTPGLRKLVIRNAGTLTTNPRGNLKLGAMGMGMPWTVTGKNPQSSPSEICVGTFDTASNTCLGTPASTYNAANGLQASATSILEVPVRITPANTDVGPNGTKEWEITIFSNDPDEPEVKITVTARPVVLPPCQYTLTPRDLNFGVVTPPSTRDLTFQVCNAAPASAMATDICLITNLDMAAGSDPMFSLPAGGQAEVELAPQQCTTVQTRAWPQGMLPATPTTVRGKVTFTISDPDPMRSQPEVNLQATLAPSCLVISPGTLDFGTVQQGCNSPDRTFTLYNACPQAVRWVGAQLIAAGDTAQPMTMNCPSSSACQEFNVVSQPNTAGLSTCTVGGASGPCLSQGGTPLSFQIKYRPVNVGSDTGAYRIQVVQANQQVDYIVTLNGRGDTMGFNTDTFRQDSRPKADILLVIDNSCSMDNEQVELGRNFTNFIKYATTSQVDFRIAVTNSDADDDAMCPACETGDFCRVGGVTSTTSSSCTNGTGDKIITPSTPDIENAFASLVKLGTLGSGLETCVVPAVRALTAPKITDPAKNGDFLRPDAVLAVVCITDALEQSNQPISFYLNQLLNIKGVQRPNMFSYNVIGPFTQLPPPCSTEGQDDGRHLSLVTGSNGLREEICTPNWATALENIGKGAFGFRTTFFLNGIPQAGNQVEVQIDGQVIPPVDNRMAEVWRYDSSINAVIFNPLYVPEPGKTLTINYRVACL